MFVTLLQASREYLLDRFKAEAAQVTETRNRLPKHIFWLMIAGAVMRLALLATSPMGNENQYEQLIIAKNMVQGHGFDMSWRYVSFDQQRVEMMRATPTPHPSAFMPPFIPAVYTLSYSLFGVNQSALYAVLIIQSVLGAFVPLLVYRVGHRFGTEGQATVASIVSLLYIPGLLSSATPAGAIFYCVAGLMVVDMSFRVSEHRFYPWLLGLTIGLLTLMRSEFLVIGLVVACLPLVRRDWKVVLPTLVTMMLVVSPWLIRNAIVFGKPVGVITHPWREVWRGANSNASGSGFDAEGWNIWEGERFPEIVRRLDSIPMDRSFELNADKVFKDEAITYVRNHPQHWLFLFLKKMTMLWTVDPYYPRGTHVAYVIPSLITGFLVLYGLFTAIRKKMAMLPIAVILVSLTGLFGLTYVQPRYQTYLFTIGMPLIACLPIPSFVQNLKNKIKQAQAP